MEKERARLKAWREIMGISPDGMGDILGCGRRSVQRLEAPGSTIVVFPDTVEMVEGMYLTFLEKVEERYALLSSKVEGGESPRLKVDYYKSQEHFCSTGKVGDYLAENCITRAVAILFEHEGVEVDFDYPESTVGLYPKVRGIEEAK